MSDWLKEARERLKEAKASQGSKRLSELWLLEDCLIQAKATPEDIGTTKREFEKLAKPASLLMGVRYLFLALVDGFLSNCGLEVDRGQGYTEAWASDRDYAFYHFSRVWPELVTSLGRCLKKIDVTLVPVWIN